MAEVDQLADSVSVRFPEMRARLRQAGGALGDPALQERLWLRGQRWSQSELGFDDTLLFIVDEMAMFRSDDLIGGVLIDESELIAFRALVTSVENLIEAIGKRAAFGDAIRSGAPWEACVAKAREMQSLLDRSAGGSE